MPTQAQREGQAAADALRASVVDLVVAARMAGDEPTSSRSESPSAGLSSHAGARPADEAGWSAQQVLAHALWWHERYLAVLSAKVDGRRRPKLVGRLDDINEIGIAAHGERSIDELVTALDAKARALESLTAVLFELPRAERRRVRIVTRDESAPVDLDGFVARVTDHLHGHASQLRGRA